MRRQLRLLEPVPGGAVLPAAADSSAPVAALAGPGVAVHSDLSAAAGTHAGHDDVPLRRHAARRPAGDLESTSQLSAGPSRVPQIPAPARHTATARRSRLSGPAGVGRTAYCQPQNECDRPALRAAGLDGLL